MAHSAPRRSSALTALSLAVLAAACGHHEHTVNGGWVQIGEGVVLRAVAEVDAEGWRSGCLLARQPGQPARVVYAWFARFDPAAAKESSKQDYRLEQNGGIGTFEELSVCKANQLRFSGTLTWDEATKRLAEVVEVDGKRMDQALGRAFVYDWRGAARTAQLAVDLPQPTDADLAGGGAELARRIADKYAAALRADAKVAAFYDGK